MKEKISTEKLGLNRRAFTLERGLIDEKRRASFPASSEEPYLRRSWSMGDFLEILDHSPKSIRLGRMKDAAPLLKDHWRDQQIGVIESAEVRDRRLYVTARFGNSQLALDEEKDVADGIRQKVSVGYLVHEMVLEKQSEDGPDVYRVTDWEPIEVSTVAIPADPTVGFGRSDGEVAYRDHVTRVVRRESAKGVGMDWIMVIRRADGVLLRIRENEFDEKLHERQDPAANPAESKTPALKVGESRGAEAVDPAAIEKRERARVEDILALGSKHNCSDKAREAIREGISVAAFRDYVWSTIPAGQPIDTPKTNLGLSRKEAESFSFRKAILACIERDWTDAPFERECSQEVAKRLDRKPQGFFVPDDVQYARVDMSLVQKRVLTVGTAATAGNLVAKELHPEQFIELLRNKMMVAQMGVQFLPGLVGNVDLPRQSGGATAGWVNEGANVGTSELTVDLVSIQPRTIGVRSDMSRKLLLQSTPGVEGLVRNDIATALALGIDNVVLNGSGTAPVPRGIRNFAGIGLVALGTNGAAPTWDSQVQLVEAVVVANADRGTLGYLTNGKMWSKLMRTPRVASFPDYILSEPGNTLLGRRFEYSEQVPSNLVKGTSGAVCSAEFYGNWAECIVGEWGVLDLFPDPYTLADSNGLVLRAFKDVDVALRHAASFAVIVDALTT